MENTFSSALKAIRKSKNITQEQLAAAVGVSAQAVSKWETNGFPDASLLPAIADYLGVTVDALFGRRYEEFDMKEKTVEYIRSLPYDQQLEKITELLRAIVCGCFNMEKYEPVPDNIYRKNEDTEYGTFSELVRHDGYIQTRLNGDLNYFLVMPECEKGYDHLLKYRDKYVEFFSFLAIPNALRAMYFAAGNGTKLFFTAETLVKELDITNENARCIIDGMLKLGFIWEADYSDGESGGKIYQYLMGINFVSFMAFTHNMVCRPISFNFQGHPRRNTVFFKNDTYKAPAAKEE